MEVTSSLSRGGSCGASPWESREEAGPHLGRRDPEASGRVRPGEVPGVQPSAFDGEVGGGGEIRGEPVLGAADIISGWDAESEEEAGCEVSAA